MDHPDRDRALKILRTLWLEAISVVAVFAEELPEAILYLTGGGKPRTAWLTRVDGKVSARDEAGFPAFPS